MKLLRQNLAKYTILESLNDKIPLPSHFDANTFTLAAMDNFKRGKCFKQICPSFLYCIIMNLAILDQFQRVRNGKY